MLPALGLSGNSFQHLAPLYQEGVGGCIFQGVILERSEGSAFFVGS